MRDDDDSFEIITSPEEMEAVKLALEAAETATTDLQSPEPPWEERPDDASDGGAGGPRYPRHSNFDIDESG